MTCHEIEGRRKKNTLTTLQGVGRVAIKKVCTSNKNAMKAIDNMELRRDRSCASGVQKMHQMA
jgi:hypothetical protein